MARLFPLLAVLVCLGACASPPMHVGYVALSPSDGRGAVDVSGNLGGGYETLAGGHSGAVGASAQVEPFVSSRTSIPVGVAAAMLLSGSTPTGVVPLRVGVRHRLGGTLSLGGGAGTALDISEFGAGVSSGAADLEVIVGHHGERVGLCAAFRPSIAFWGEGFSLLGIVEPQVSVRLSSVRLTAGALMGPSAMYYAGDWQPGVFSGAMVGLHRRF